MTQPANWQNGTIKGTWQLADFTPYVGKARITPDTKVIRAYGVANLLMDATTVDLVDGAFEVTRPAGNDPDVSPTNFTYTVEILTAAGAASGFPKYTFVLPVDGIVDLTTVTVVNPSPGIPNIVGSGGGVSSWNDLQDKPAVIAAGADAATARAAIGAGTSNLIIGTTAGTAKDAAALTAWTDVTGKPLTFPPSAHTTQPSDLVGSTSFGQSLLSLAAEGALRTKAGMSSVGNSLATASDGPAARAAIGATSVEDVTAAVDALGLSTAAADITALQAGQDNLAVILGGVTSNTLAIEDAVASVVLPSISAATTQLVVTALAPCTLGQMTLTFTTGVTASDTNYWTVDLIRYVGGAPITVATKTTKMTGGQAIESFKEWNFDLIDLSAAGFNKGESLSVKFTPTGTPGPLSGGVASYRLAPSDGGDIAAPPPTVLVSDSFTRADSTASLGTPDVGAAWTILSGNWGINGNQAYSPNSTATEKAVIDTGQSDVTVDVKLVALATSGSAGIYIRASDASNGFQLATDQFYRTQAGALTPLAGGWLQSGGTGVFVAGDTMRVRASGGTFTIYRQAGSTGSFVQLVQVSDSFNQTVTKHGLRMSGNAGNVNRMDDFKVTTP